MSAEKSWCRPRGFCQLAKVIDGVRFNDGVEVVASVEEPGAALSAHSVHQI